MLSILSDEKAITQCLAGIVYIVYPCLACTIVLIRDLQHSFDAISEESDIKEVGNEDRAIKFERLSSSV